MGKICCTFLLLAGAQLCVAEPPAPVSRSALEAPAGISTDFGRCGQHAYDDGSAEDALFFGGGHADDPNFAFAVFFDVTAFGFDPDEAMLESFCAPNSLDFTGFGGPWPNEIFVLANTTQTRGRDNTPLENVVIAQGTVVTGDGLGNSTVTLPQPVPLPGKFWVLNRGDPMHAGEDFNMETDQNSSSRRRSFITDRGLFFLFPSFQNLMLQVTIRGPQLEIPLFHGIGVGVLVVLLGLLGFGAIRRRAQ